MTIELLDGVAHILLAIFVDDSSLIGNLLLLVNRVRQENLTAEEVFIELSPLEFIVLLLQAFRYHYENLPVLHTDAKVKEVHEESNQSAAFLPSTSLLKQLLESLLLFLRHKV